MPFNKPLRFARKSVLPLIVAVLSFFPFIFSRKWQAMANVDDLYAGIEADEVRYFHNPKTGKVDAVAGSDVNLYLKENGLTNNRGTYWRDAGGNAYDLPDGMDEEAWLKEWEAVGNPLTRAEDGHNRADYAEEVYKYRTPKGDVSVRMGDDGAFRKEYAATFGGAPERLSSRMFNGVLFSGPQSALLNLASVTQGNLLTAEQLKSLGATDDDIARGANLMRERLLLRDNEAKQKLGRVGFLENEMRNRALVKSGAEATGGASMAAAYGQAVADVAMKPLNIVGLGLVSVRDFGDMALQYGGEDGLEKLKGRGAVQSWLDRWRLLGWRGMGRDPFTDEQWHEIFKEGLRKIKRNERLDEIRGKTWGATIGSGAIDMAEYSGEMASITLVCSHRVEQDFQQAETCAKKCQWAEAILLYQSALRRNHPNVAKPLAIVQLKEDTSELTKHGTVNTLRPFTMRGDAEAQTALRNCYKRGKRRGEECVHGCSVVSQGRKPRVSGSSRRVKTTETNEPVLLIHWYETL